MFDQISLVRVLLFAQMTRELSHVRMHRQMAAQVRAAGERLSAERAAVQSRLVFRLVFPDVAKVRVPVLENQLARRAPMGNSLNRSSGA